MEIVLRSKVYNYQTKLREKYSVNIQDATINKYFDVSKNYVTQFVLSLPDLLGSFLEWLFLIPLFMYFMIVEGRNYQRLFLTTIPNSYFEKIYYLIHQFDKKIGGYIFAKSVEATIVGILVGIGLAVVGFPFAFLMGLAAGVTNIIPYLGPILGMIPAALVFIVSPEYSHLIGPVLIVFLAANLLDMFLIFPVLVARIVNLHPLVVIVSVIIGSQLWGVVGMIVSVPAANIIKLLFGEIYRELYPVAQKQEN
jgi:putative permease